MKNIKRFDEYIKEDMCFEKVEQLIVENTIEFTDKAEITDSEISNFRQRQEEILQKYPSLSDMDRDNITNRMDSIISDNTIKIDNIDTNVTNT